MIGSYSPSTRTLQAVAVTPGSAGFAGAVSLPLTSNGVGVVRAHGGCRIVS